MYFLLSVNPEEWEAGFFDHGTWEEIMRPWAQTVIVGRARLGGIPMGVIAVETRKVELTLPADPANLDSESKVSKYFSSNNSYQSFNLVPSQLITSLSPSDCIPSWASVVP